MKKVEEDKKISNFLKSELPEGPYNPYLVQNVKNRLPSHRKGKKSFSPYLTISVALFIAIILQAYCFTVSREIFVKDFVAYGVLFILFIFLTFLFFIRELKCVK